MALILIADDDEVVVEVVREALTASGHIVGAVDDGFPVLEIVTCKQPALVILDCNMPEVSGMEVLRRLRHSALGADTPVLMLTSRQSRKDEWIARGSGASDYLRKPFDPSELVARVELLLCAAAAKNRPLNCNGSTPHGKRGWGQR